MPEIHANENEFPKHPESSDSSVLFSKRVKVTGALAAALALGLPVVYLSCTPTETTKDPPVAAKEKQKKILLESGAIRVCEKPSQESTLFVGIYPGGVILFATHKNMNDRGLLKTYLADRQADRRDPVVKDGKREKTGAGSGFILRVYDRDYLCSNEHVLRDAKAETLEKAVLDSDADFGIAPIEICTKKSSYVPMELSNINKKDLAGREVTFSGLGRYYFEVSGKTQPILPIEQQNVWPIMPTVSEGMPRFVTDDFYVPLKKTDVIKAMGIGGKKFENYKDLFSGMSGSAVIDKQTGKVVGIFSSHIGLPSYEDDVLLVFTPVTKLRPIVDRMAMKK